jgi:DNA-binding MarR family transcriptional regulator
MPDANFTDSQKTALRTWLKLLSVSGQMRKQLQSRLQAAHGMSLSRFDILANLYRAPEGGVRLSALSDQLMVSNGNVTQVLSPLVKDGLVVREKAKEDARAATARLTEKGRTIFMAMAADHACWVEELMNDLSVTDQQTITTLLGNLDLKDV